jgi:hypothetical protein
MSRSTTSSVRPEPAGGACLTPRRVAGRVATAAAPAAPQDVGPSPHSAARDPSDNARGASRRGSSVPVPSGAGAGERRGSERAAGEATGPPAAAETRPGARTGWADGGVMLRSGHRSRPRKPRRCPRARAPARAAGRAWGRARRAPCWQPQAPSSPPRLSRASA